MSYLITDPSIEKLIEGINLISKYYPAYNPDNLYTTDIEEYYSLNMILKSLENYSFKEDFLKIMIFDCLIGNSDRHQSNWAIIKKDINGSEAKLAPLYDNGSSLCCYIQENQIESYLGKDELKFNSIIFTKSRSRIRLNGKVKKSPEHFEVLKFIKNNYYTSTKEFVDNICNTIDNDSIDNILKDFNSELLSDKRKKLIKKFLIKRIELMRVIFI